MWDNGIRLDIVSDEEFDELPDKSSPGRLRLCILHNRLSGPMSSSVLRHRILVP